MIILLLQINKWNWISNYKYVKWKLIADWNWFSDHWFLKIKAYNFLVEWSITIVIVECIGRGDISLGQFFALGGKKVL